MSTSKEFRQRAWKRVTGDLGGYLIPFLVLFVGLFVGFAIIGRLLTADFPLSFVGGILYLLFYLFALLLVMGLSYIYMQKRERVTSLEDLLYACKHEPALNLLTVIRASIQIMLWSCLLMVPGIIKSFSYGMYPYLLMDEDMEFEDTGDVIKTSMAMMDGNKMRLFKLMLSFIGWFILCSFTFGLAYFFVLPYFMAAVVEFYEEVKESYFGQQS